MIGTRLRDPVKIRDLHSMPGSYGQIDGVWLVCTPNGLMGALRDHAVVEHEDGSITVAPSILFDEPHGQYHGYLERGSGVACSGMLHIMKVINTMRRAQKRAGYCSPPSLLILLVPSCAGAL